MLSMDGKDFTYTQNSSGQNFMPEKPLFCKKEILDFITEDHYEAMDSMNNKTFEAVQDDLSEDFNTCSEEKLLLEGRLQNNQPETTESSRKTTDIFSSEKEAKLSDITSQDEGVPRADMFVCQSCHAVFIDELELRSHMFEEHRPKIGRPRKMREIEMKPSEENCTPNVQKLAKRTAGSKVFVCDQCPYTVTRCDSMTKHVLRVHSKGIIKPQFMCEICGKTFMDLAYLRNHSLSHSHEPQYFCEICGRRFHRQPSLKRHIQSHSEEKQFSCSLCDYQTNRKHLMCKHAENHRTGKAYGCKHCAEKFFTQMLLRKHRYTHHPTRYACSFCKIGFSSRERMWSHLQKIHFTCEIKDLKTEDSMEVKVEYIEVKMEPKS